MQFKGKWSAMAVMAVLVGGIGVIIWKFVAPSGDASTIAVNIPAFSADAARGQELYNANCAQCHGDNGGGTEKGPPFIDRIYNPGHHGDAAFLSAVNQGVRQHHWRFGDMPPQPQVSGQEVALIVRYIRELQMANGIVYQQHNM